MEFFSDSHEYRRNGKVYQSVSQFLEKFKKPFPKGMLAERVAQKNGREAQDMINQWDLNAQISCDYGNSIHKGIEYWIRYGEMSKLAHIKIATEKFAKKHDRTKLKPEIIVFNDELMLAGTLDQLELLGGKKVKILDIKTNAELTDDGNGYFLPPLDKLPHSKINGYRLQLSMYKYLLELKGFKVEGMELEHWDGKDFKTIVLEPINVEVLFNPKADNKLGKKTIKI